MLNSIVVLVHHYGPNVNGRIMQHAPGVTISLEVNGTAVMGTNPQWRSSNATQYLPSPLAWSSIPDVIDARLMTALGGDWTQPTFNDSAWVTSVSVNGSSWGVLMPRAIPLPVEAPLPQSLLMPSNSPLVLPLTLSAGTSIILNLTQMAMVFSVVQLDTSTQPGSEIHLEFALRFQNGAPSETYGVGTTYTTTVGAQTFFSLDTWCGHYVTLSLVSGSPVTILGLQFVRRSYPFSRLGSFNSSDQLLTEVWRRAVNTQLAVADDSYGSDARERNEWLQDPAQPNFITTRVALAGPSPSGQAGRPAYADGRLLKNLLRHAALSALPDGRILSTFPTDRGPEDCHYSIEDYAMQFVEAVRILVDSTGDTLFVREVYPAIIAQLAYFNARVIDNSTGVPGSLANGLLLARQYTSFDDPLAYVHVQGGALNAFYAKSLLDAAYLASLLNETAQASQFAAAAVAVTDAINKDLWNADVGSYNSGILPNGTVVGPSVHAALLALERGVVPAARLASVQSFFLKNYKNQGFFHCCQNDDTASMISAKAGVDFPVVYYWVFNTLYSLDTNSSDLEALSEIRRRFGAMVLASPDIDTMWESFQDSESCHNYGEVPAYFMSSYVLGVRLGAAGVAGVGALVIEPRLGDLEWAQGNVVTEFGVVTVSWALSAHLYLNFTLSLPQDVRSCELRVPGLASSLLINGSPWPASSQGRWVVAQLGAGPTNFSGSISLF